MAEIKWIKITTDVFDDEKIKIIETLPEGDSVLIIWFKLLCKAGKLNSNGEIFLQQGIPYTDEMLSTVFNKPLNVVRLALQTFLKFQMIEISDTESIFITNWGKHQNVDGMERAKELARARKEKHRNKQKLLMERSSHVPCHETVTQSHAIDIDKELDIDIDINNINIINGTKTKKFKKPTISEIQSYCLERKNNVDGERFFDFYEAKGWMVGKNKMKDWQAAIRTWEKNNPNTPKKIITNDNEVDYEKLSR